MTTLADSHGALHGLWGVLGIAHGLSWATRGGTPFLLIGLVVVLIAWRMGRRARREH